MTKAPLLLHIPHNSQYIPKKVRKQISLLDSELESELLRMTDHYTDILFDISTVTARSIIYPVNRLVVDPERFEDDDQEPMAKIGMGVVYTATSLNGTLRLPPGDSERVELLDTYYRPHHSQFTEGVNSVLRNAGRALIIDCHSFPGKPWPYELNQEEDRPDFCIGTDSFHTPDNLRDGIRGLFEEQGYSVYINRPFGGTIVPLQYYKQDLRVESIMIEVNRKLYMNEKTGEKSSNFNTIKNDIEKAITRLCELF